MKKGKTSRIFFGLALSLIFTVIVGGIVLDDTPEPPDNQVSAEFQAVVDDIVLQSIIDVDEISTTSDNNIVKNFLEESGLSITEKFGIETQIAIISPDGTNIDNESGIIGIAQTEVLSVLDEDGKPRDLDTIQTTFLGITRDVEASTNISGTVEFWLDDTLIKTKRLWASTDDSNRVQLSIVDSLVDLDNFRVSAPSFSAQEKINFSFSLSDEGKSWIDKSEHTYRVVITDIHAFIDSNNDTKEFHWTGQHLAYKLTLKVDESKNTILNNANKAITISKSDSRLQYTGELRVVATISPSVSYYGAHQPRVAILDVDSNVIYDSLNDSRYSSEGKIQGWATGDAGHKPATDLIIYDGLSRDTDYIIRVYDDVIGTTDYPYHTKLSQENLGIGCSMDSTHQTNFVSKAWHIHTHGCYSTFGYESPDYQADKN